MPIVFRSFIRLIPDISPETKVLGKIGTALHFESVTSLSTNISGRFTVRCSINLIGIEPVMDAPGFKRNITFREERAEISYGKTVQRPLYGLALNLTFCFLTISAGAGRSSNGKTDGSGPSDRGSNPCLPATILWSIPHTFSQPITVVTISDLIYKEWDYQ